MAHYFYKKKVLPCEWQIAINETMWSNEGLTPHWLHLQKSASGGPFIIILNGNVYVTVGAWFVCKQSVLVSKLMLQMHVLTEDWNICLAKSCAESGNFFLLFKGK